LKCLHVSTIAWQIDGATLQKTHQPLAKATSILDPNYVIGVWASASRKSMRVLNGDGTETESGDWVQVSRLGMPLTNEAVNPIGVKDLWNSLTPYQDYANIKTFGNYFYNPELALYMDTAQFGAAVPSFSQLRIQKKSLGAYGFGNGQDGLYPLKGNPALNGTALAESAFGGLLLPAAASPRSVDIWPIFNTGVPNLAPYQLATGKAGNPLAVGKPFINNFLPAIGDMLRLNMAVPPTQRTDPNFSSEGLVEAAVLGLTNPAYNGSDTLQWIPNMDGFPNGRRLEDDVTRIELQAVSGVVLAAIGLWYDDYVPGSPNPVTPDLVNVLTYSTGVNSNDTTLRTNFPYEQLAWSGEHVCACATNQGPKRPIPGSNINAVVEKLNISAPSSFASAFPNPFTGSSTIRYRLTTASNVSVIAYDMAGKPVQSLVNAKQNSGTYTVPFDGNNLTKGVYFVNVIVGGQVQQSLRVEKQ
jgi:hypothetical protein